MKIRLIAALALLTIALCELGLRLLAGEIHPPPLYPGDMETVPDSTFDPLVGWKLPLQTVMEETSEEYSSSYSSNAQGFRSRRDFSLPLSGRRIAFLGDSYTFGSGVEDDETFAHLLGSMFPDTRSYNFGIGAFGLDQMLLTLRHYALPVEPELVILSFIRYDLDRSLSSYREDHAWRWKPAFRLSDGELLPMTLESRPGALVSFFHQQSHLFRLWRSLQGSLNRRWAVGYRWRLNRAIFEAIRDECVQARVPLVVVHIPVNRRNPAPLLGREFADMGVDLLDL